MSTGGSGSDGEGEGSCRPPGTARLSSTRRFAPTGSARTSSSTPLALEFEGPPLALPGEVAAWSGESGLGTAPPNGPADLAARPVAVPGSMAGPSALGSRDGWARMREAEAPARPRSTRPPPGARDEALGLVRKRARRSSAPGADLSAEMSGRFALGDFSGALRAAELVLGRDASDVEAARTAAESRERLTSIYRARLGVLFGAPPEALAQRVPVVVVPPHEVRWLGLDHRQGFGLWRIDGESTLEVLADVAGVPALELLRVLVELGDLGAVDLVVR